MFSVLSRTKYFHTVFLALWTANKNVLVKHHAPLVGSMVSLEQGEKVTNTISSKSPLPKEYSY